MKKTPTISVILPAYNAERFIDDAIQSILNQTFSDFELIIINDGSTDQTLAKITKFSDPRITVLQHQSNLGIVASLNKGLSVCQGEFIARMDADDISLPRRFDIQLDYFRMNNAVDIVCGLMTFFGEKHGLIQQQTEPFKDMGISLFFECQVYQPTVMIRRKILVEKKLSYRQDFVYCEDWALWLDCIDADLTIHRLSDLLVMYRISDQNCSIALHNNYFINKNKLDRLLLGILFNKVSERMIELQFELVYAKIPTKPLKELLLYCKNLTKALINFGFSSKDVKREVKARQKQYGFRLADHRPLDALIFTIKTGIWSYSLTRYIGIQAIKKIR
ncbi:MAG: glycosyltransferase family 2 protein [Crocinitomicaceae bacterium]